MLSNSGDNHSEHEESEYHFSDEDVSYEVETDSSKPAASSGEARASLFSRVSSSKRMLISLVVFVALVFVVYKMVVPGSEAPSTDIAPQAAAPISSSPPSATPAMQTAQETTAPTQPPAIQTQPQTTTANNSELVVPGAPNVPTPTAQPEQKPSEQNPEVVVSMPAVIPVQSNVPTSPAPTTTVSGTPTSPPPLATPTTPTTTTPGSTDSAIASMVATNEKLINQLQAGYNQRLVEYESQSKAMQGQIETLNSRVATMESQLNQLVQALNRSQAPTSSPTSPPPMVQEVIPMQEAGPTVRVLYSVQAIIPGRAWLRSESGETVTVAEGDTIKGLGRVTKIDPYDGVVEVNTGNKVVSISYGNTE